MSKAQRMPVLYELHSHLYGCLELEDLYWLARRRKPRWEVFSRSYRAAYKQEPRLSDLFTDTRESKNRLSSYYYFKNKSGFRSFQICFDLVIALSHTDREELREICLRVAGRESANYAEYRMMFSPFISAADFWEKSLALCEGLAAAEEQYPEKAFRAVLSLSRDDQKAGEQYELLQRLMQENSLVRKFLIAIDFCHQEEGYPPERKQAFFKRVHADNKKHPARALALLYHVGESYNDKSVESAVRWVVEAAQMGAHRLGHAVALGVTPEFYLGITKKESIQERLAQIAFEKKHAASLADFGYAVDPEELEREARRPGQEEGWIDHHYDDRRLMRLHAFQDWAMAQVRETGAVIECCPTSNLTICGLASPAHHPLRRFLEKGLRVVIGSDDPGILGTSLKKEYERIRAWPGITIEAITQLQKNAMAWTSPALSGRN